VLVVVAGGGGVGALGADGRMSEGPTGPALEVLVLEGPAHVDELVDVDVDAGRVEVDGGVDAGWPRDVVVGEIMSEGQMLAFGVLRSHWVRGVTVGRALGVTAGRVTVGVGGWPPEGGLLVDGGTAGGSVVGAGVIGA
jgi:hypothetical protein